MKICIINGPNLNLLGKRQPEIYGSQSFEEYLEVLRKDFPDVTFEYFQSNHEGALIDKLHEVGFSEVAIIINPGGLTHTSVSLADAVAAIESPVVEVHISNIYNREKFRRHSYIEAFSSGQIVGMGLEGYRMAVELLIENEHN